MYISILLTISGWKCRLQLFGILDWNINATLVTGWVNASEYAWSAIPIDDDDDDIDADDDEVSFSLP